MNCPACGTPDISEKQTFCPACQAYLDKPKYARKAPVHLRFIAFLIDMVSLWGTPFLILLGLNLYITGKFAFSAVFHRATWVERGASANFLIFVGVIAFSLWIAYAVYVMLQAAKGATPGKKYLKLRVQKVDGSHLDFWSVFVMREIAGRLVSMIPLFLGHIWAIWDAKGQAWHDKIANTLVLQLSKATIEREKKQKSTATGGIMINMRDNAAAILFFLVVLFILSLMFSGGLGGVDITDDIVAFFTGGGTRGVIAKVNDQEINYDDYNTYYQQKMEEYQKEKGSSPEGYQLETFENDVWNEMVNTILLSQYIEKNDLLATDEEVIYELKNNPPQDIRNEPVFQKDGLFDRSLYLEAWQKTDDPRFDRFWEYMEARARQMIPRQKLYEKILSTVRVTDGELKSEYLNRNQEVTVRFVFFDPTQIKDEAVQVTDSELKDYYNAHQEDFVEKAKRKIAYVTFSTKATASDSAATRARADEILALAKSSDDFGKLAQEYSMDKGSAENGGDLGFFSREAMVKPFSDAAFAAAKGEIVGPVVSQFGLHIIKVEDRKVEGEEEKVQARHILIKFDPSDDTKSLAVKNARYFSEAAQRDGFANIAAQENLKIDTTAFFPEGGFIPGIGRDMKASKFIFSKVVGSVSHPYQFRDGYVVFKIKDAQDERTKSFEEVRTQIASRVKNERKIEMQLKAATEFREKMRDLNLAEVNGRDSLNVKQTNPFKRNGFVEGGVGRESKFIGAAFGLDAGEISKPIQTTRGIYILEVVDKTPFNEQDFDIQRDKLFSEVLQSKQQRAYSLWFYSVRESAQIKDFRDRYFL